MAISTQAVPALRGTQRRSALTSGSRAALISTLSRVGTICLVIFLLGILPLLSGRDVAVSVFRTRY